MNNDESALKQAFRELRAKDAQLAGAFAESWARAASGKAPARARSWLPPVLATAILTAWGFYISLRPTPPPPVSISEWRAPTDVFLRGAEKCLLRTTPRFGESIIDKTR